MELKNMDLPEEYYVGQEFVEDPNIVEVVIHIFFYSPAVLEQFEFFIGGIKVIGIQTGGLLHIYFEQIISAKLLDSLGNGKSVNFLIGYVSRYLPRINQEILRQRYSLGHFLVRTFSTLDIYRIGIIPKGIEEITYLSWPPSITSFPPVKQFRRNRDEIHIRDFIDAGNSYLNADYDDCIRKVITSAENAFRFYDLKSNTIKGFKKYFQWLLPKQTSFVGIIRRYIFSNRDFGRRVVAENLIFIYKLRNKIVHDKFRIRFENGWICKKAIGTLKYLYQFLGQSNGIAKYVHYLGAEFIMLDEESNGLNLDQIRASEKFAGKLPIIDSPAKLDKFMFEGLRISTEEKHIVLKNRIPPGFYRK